MAFAVNSHVPWFCCGLVKGAASKLCTGSGSAASATPTLTAEILNFSRNLGNRFDSVFDAPLAPFDVFSLFEDQFTVWRSRKNRKEPGCTTAGLEIFERLIWKSKFTVFFYCGLQNQCIRGASRHSKKLHLWHHPGHRNQVPMADHPTFATVNQSGKNLDACCIMLYLVVFVLGPQKIILFLQYLFLNVVFGCSL